MMNPRRGNLLTNWATNGLIFLDIAPTLVAANPNPTEVQEDNGKLAPYLVNHNEYSVSSGMHGMLPYVRIVGYESRQ